MFPAVGGHFGRAGKNTGVRIIEVKDPEKAAKKFWNKISEGAMMTTTKNGHPKAVFGSGSLAIFRLNTSTPGSPGISIVNKVPNNGFAPAHRIHFVQSKG